MSEQTVATAQMKCSFGSAPAVLTVTSNVKVKVSGLLAATIMDHAPTTNIPTFGMCSSLTNPQVASATSAAQGVLTPQPCVPATASPWTPGATKTKFGVNPALTKESKCTCNWGGVIEITNSGQAPAKLKIT